MDARQALGEDALAQRTRSASQRLTRFSPSWRRFDGLTSLRLSTGAPSWSS
jgi:hypothetical protein